SLALLPAARAPRAATRPPRRRAARRSRAVSQPAPPMLPILSMLQVNIIALTELTRLVLPQMVARKHGKVMLLASLAAFQPGPGMAVYYATKAYVLSFGRAIGHELRGTGVTITTLCPGPTTSEFAEVANMQGVALFEGPVPVMTAAEVARQGYAALKAG